MRHRAALVAGSLALALAGTVPCGAADGAAGGWRPFEGTWSASGKRQAIAIEGAGTAFILEVAGAVVLTVGEGLSRGFHGEAIGYDDGQGASFGRCVWTDERGDRIFSRLAGEPLRTGRRVVGTITGGTGRYAGLEGEYSFTWKYLVPGDEGAVQGRAVGLAGRVRRAEGP